MVHVVAYVSTLMQYAHELGEAKKSGDAGRIAAAQKRHDDYHEVCLKADELVGPVIPWMP